MERDAPHPNQPVLRLPSFVIEPRTLKHPGNGHSQVLWAIDRLLARGVSEIRSSDVVAELLARGNPLRRGHVSLLLSRMASGTNARPPVLERLRQGVYRYIDTSASDQRSAQDLVRARTALDRDQGQRLDSDRDMARRVVPGRAATARASCRDCGRPLARRRQVRCPDCLDARPGQARETRRRRGQAIAAARIAQEAWRDEHATAVCDRQAFLAQVTPRLHSLRLRQIMDAAGVTKATASSYRSGKSVPHPLYWPALMALIGMDAAELIPSS